MARSRQAEFIPLRIAVMTVSDSRTRDNDTAGDTLVECLSAAGHQLAGRHLSPDDVYQLRSQLSQWIVDPAIQVILISGGTGFTGRDQVPRAVTPLLDRQMEGFGELFRHLSYLEIGTATIQSRALAGFANGAFICCLPGSPGACLTAWKGILLEQLDSRTGPCNAVAHIRQPGAPCAPCEARS